MFSREQYEVSVCETGARPGTVIVNAAAPRADEAHLARVARVRRMLRMCSLYGGSVQVHAAQQPRLSAMSSQLSPDMQKVWVPPTQADREQAARVLSILQGLATNGQVGTPPIDPRSTSITDEDTSRHVLAQMARQAAAQAMPNYQVQSNVPPPAFQQQQLGLQQPFAPQQPQQFAPQQQQFAPQQQPAPSADALRADQAARFMQRLQNDPNFARQAEQLLLDGGKTDGGPAVAVSPALQQAMQSQSSAAQMQSAAQGQSQPAGQGPEAMLAMMAKLQSQLDEAKADKERAEFDKLWESIQVGASAAVASLSGLAWPPSLSLGFLI